MNGYLVLADSYKKLMNEGKVESSAFNDIIRAFLKKAVKDAGIGHHESEAVMDSLYYVFDEKTAKEVLNNE